MDYTEAEALGLVRLREAVRTALGNYRRELAKHLYEGLEGTNEDVLVSMTEIESAARVLWLEDLT